jgi:mevalonate kinase
MNHELLGALGVSSPPLDELVAKLISHHALGAKLTGAGQGGCVFGLFAQAQDVLELDGQSAICVTIATRSPS